MLLTTSAHAASVKNIGGVLPRPPSHFPSQLNMHPGSVPCRIASYTNAVILESVFKLLQEDTHWSLFYLCVLAFSQLMLPLTALSAVGWLVFVIGFGILNSR